MEWKKIREFVLKIILAFLLGEVLLTSGFVKVYLFDDKWFLVGLVIFQVVIELISYISRQEN